MALTCLYSYNVSPEELFELFGKYGPIRYVTLLYTCRHLVCSHDTNTLNSQVRQGIAANTKGTAFVVYDDVMDAKQACDKLNGFNFQGRYLVGMCTTRFAAPVFRSYPSTTHADPCCPVLYHQPEKMAKSKEDLEARKENLAQLKKQHGID